MNSIPKLILSDIPEEGLRFFHGLSNWVEQSKISKPSFIKWKQGQKALVKLTCVKPKSGNQVELPNVLPDNTLYLPFYSSGYYVFCQLRHAFCHDNLVYDKEKRQYCIELTDNVKIAGLFSLEAIKELVGVFLPVSK